MHFAHEEEEAVQAPASPEPEGPRSGFWDRIESPGSVLAILALINFINYVDRQVLAALVPLLEKPVEEGGLGLSWTQLGLLQTAFMVVHSVASIPLGILADRYLRKNLIAIGVGLWSVATAIAGFARNFTQIFLARAAIGVGEATYAPAASALISDKFPPAARARAMGIFQVGMILGGAAAVVIGGLVGGAWGWRAAFFVVGGPGLLLTILILMVREPQRRTPATAPKGASPGGSLAIDAREALLRSPAAIWVNVSGILITFFVGALIFWAPKFTLKYHYGDDADLLRKVTTTFGAVAAAAGLIGTLAGSFIADRLEKRRPGEGRLLTIAAGVLLSVPCALFGFYAGEVWQLYSAVALGVFFNAWYVGPILAALHDVVPPRLRGTATGVYFLVIHLFGDAFSPAIIGRIAQSTGSLRVGLAVATGILALGGLAALAAIPHSRRLARLKRGGATG